MPEEIPAVLREMLKPLKRWYDLQWIEEIAVNRPGEVWLRLRNMTPQWVAQDDPALTRRYFEDLFSVIAHTYDQSFDPATGSPVLYTTLPGDHRFSGILGKNVMWGNEDMYGGVALVIRAHAATMRTLESYNFQEGNALHPLRVVNPALPEDPYKRLEAIIASGEPLLLSGATASGKTSLLNYFLTLLPATKRIITIEDSRELMVTQPNHVHLLISRTEAQNKFDYENLIDLMMRFSPDVIMGGEVSTQNAATLWQLMTTGHTNFYTTIHAESAEEAIDTFADRVVGTSPQLDRAQLVQEMRRKFHVIQLQSDGAIRTISEIV